MSFIRMLKKRKKDITSYFNRLQIWESRYDHVRKLFYEYIFTTYVYIRFIYECIANTSVLRKYTIAHPSLSYKRTF